MIAARCSSTGRALGSGVISYCFYGLNDFSSINKALNCLWLSNVVLLIKGRGRGILWRTGNGFFPSSSGIRREIPACWFSVSPPHPCIHPPLRSTASLTRSFPVLAPHLPPEECFTFSYCIIFSPYNKNNIYIKCWSACVYLSLYFTRGLGLGTC